MKAIKVLHKNEDRIKIDFSYNREIISRLRQIPDARWSKTMNSWHIPLTKYSVDLFNTLFPEDKIEIGNDFFDSTKTQPERKEAEKPIISSLENKKGVSVYVTGRIITITLPKNQDDTQFILSLRYSRWDAKQFAWKVPNYPGNIDRIKEYFKNRIVELKENEDITTDTSSTSKQKIGKNDLLIIKTKSGRLKVIFGYNISLINVLKKIPYSIWDSKNKWWSIPYSEKFVDDLSEIAAGQNYSVIIEEEKVDTSKKIRISPNDIPNYRRCPDDYILKLKELRYSENTIRSYRSLFEEFINFYHKVDIDKIDESKITGFLRYLVIERKVSSSYQNQSINAIKFYYERVLGGQRKVYMVDRPRDEKTLPIVLSESEIEELIRVTENIKHKAILMLAYSAGLRLNELIKVRLTDLDTERMQIRVEQGKGKKDRYTLLSHRFLEVLKEYFIIYKPKDWLFEGTGTVGGQYSTSSIQAIMRDSVKKAGIEKRVSVHSLRHSFATHLLENGTDMRYIQSLLGHSSSKTTEVYTHITTKGFDQIKSPLDNLKNL